MATQKQVQRALIWAIDPFDETIRPDRGMVRELQNLAKREGCSILPVHVVSLQDGRKEEPHAAGWVQDYLTYAERSVTETVRSLGLEESLAPRVLLERSSSRKKAVGALIALAEESQAPAIVVSSHGRKGVGRLILGSFAENLLDLSTAPVLFLTHSLPPEGSWKRILFATDFSDESREAFKAFLPHARKLEAEVVLFHSITLPDIAIPGYGLNPSSGGFPEEFFESQEAWCKTESERWLAEGQAQGVPVRIEIDDSGIGARVAGKILEFARRKCVGLLAMSSVTGPLTSAVAGSVAREVFRANRYPVWVIGPNAGKAD